MNRRALQTLTRDRLADAEHVVLIQYDRRAGRVVRLERFTNDQWDLAAETRLELELELQHRRVEHEVVLLDAASEDALRKTRGRYFEDIEGLLALMASI